MQVDALQRLIDQENFFRSRYLTQDSIDILERYSVDYVIAPSGSNLDIQFRLAPGLVRTSGRRSVVQPLRCGRSAGHG